MRQFRPLLTAALLFAVIPANAQEAPVPQESSPFSAAERTALHAEIRDYMLENPEILKEMVQILDEKDKVATAASDETMVADNADAIFNDGFSWVTGNPDGSVTLVEFLDYQCGFCRRAMPEVTQLLEEDGDIRLIVKELPILGPGSELAARAAVATMISQGPDAYGRLHDALMGLKGEITDVRLDKVLTETGLDPEAVRTAMQDPEVDRRLAATRALAEKLAISGTPTFVLDDQMLRGYLPLPQMQALVADLRTEE